MASIDKDWYSNIKSIKTSLVIDLIITHHVYNTWAHFVTITFPSRDHVGSLIDTVTGDKSDELTGGRCFTLSEAVCPMEHDGSCFISLGTARYMK